MMSNTIDTVLMVSQLVPHEDNPRKDLGNLDELTESIRKNGVLQNLTVVPNDDRKTFTVLIGHRRLEAAKRAGVTKVRCRVISGLSRNEQIGIMLEENLHRTDLTAYEQAQGFQMMMDLGSTIDEIKSKTGFSETTIRHRLNLAKLDQGMMREKTESSEYQISMTDLYELEKVDDIGRRNEILGLARSQNDLIRMVNNYLRSTKIERNMIVAKYKLDQMLIREGTKKEEANKYSGKYEHVCELYLENLDVSVLDEIEDPDKSFWLRLYSTVVVYREKEHEEKSAYQLEREEQERNAKHIKAIWKEICKDREQFIRDLGAGKYETPPRGKLLDRMNDAVRFAVGLPDRLTPLFVSASYACPYFTDVSPSTIRGNEDKVEQMLKDQPPLYLLLAIIDSSVKGWTVIEYTGTAATRTLKQIRWWHEILSEYGYNINNEEWEQVLDGTHPLYKKPKEGNE